MRKLSMNDLFKAFAITEKLKIKDEIKAIYEANGNDAQAAGFDIIFLAISKAANTQLQKDVTELLAGPLEVTPEEFANGALLDNIKALLSEDVADLQGWSDFFTHLKTLMKNRE